MVISNYCRGTLLLLTRTLVILDNFGHSFCENMKFKVISHAEILSNSKEIADWKVKSNIECHVRCGTVKDCIRVQYDVAGMTCKAYSHCNGDVQLNVAGVVSEKVGQYNNIIHNLSYPPLKLWIKFT